MIRIVLLTFVVLTFKPYSSSSQEYSYTHYDISEGLAGSTAYCITQDKEGFIWIGTETGVSRFDGTHFENFGTIDGLPDVEVLQMLGDSKGRVWMAPFRRSVCYYYKGKIHNQGNDSALKNIHLKGAIQNFAEDRDGNILIGEMKRLQILNSNGQVRQYDSIDHRPIESCGAISSSGNGHFLVQERNNFYELSDSGFRSLFSVKTTNSFTQTEIVLSPKWVVWRASILTMGLKSLLTQKEQYFAFPLNNKSFSIISDSLLYLNEAIGCTEYNIHTGASKLFLPGVEVSRTFRDDEGNTWFTTLGQGIFRLNSDEFLNMRLEAGRYDKCPIYSLLKVGNELFAGSGHNLVFKFQLPGLKKQQYGQVQKEGGGRILFIDTLNNARELFFGMDYLLGRFTPDLHFLPMEPAHVKMGFRKNEKELLLTSSTGCTLFDLSTFRSVDTLFHERSTAVYFRNDTTYIGTLNGLYLVKKDRSVVYMGDGNIPFFKKRISAITSAADGTLWIAAYDDGGVIGYKNGQVVATITRRQGLTSDICRNLLVCRNYLWVGTDKGLNKIDLSNPEYPVTHYTSNDGLGSDIVNTVYADGPMIYVGTSAGLSFFDESRTNINAGCRLALLGVINSGKDKMQDTADLRLHYTDNNIRFEFVGISYKSVGNILYKYRLTGLDSNWKNTKETFLEYPSLPSGNYEFQLIAINKFGVKSLPVSVRFIVPTPFWRAGWFYGLNIALFLVLTWLFLTWRIRSIRQRQEEKEQLGKKMAEMERMALQAQMNPHFIFNCLNSIQQYIFDKDIFAANKYITGFAKLIRGTLQNSAQAHIPLADEIAYLSAYLSLEKLRFKEKMVYSIGIDPGVKEKEKDIWIPPMLIQPYVENSMRHGLRHKTDGQGHILIRFMFLEGKLAVSIEDNGVGREKAASYKTREHIEYQSKGMSLTADRIRLINSVYDDNIKIEVTDLRNENNQPAGTRVLLQFSRFDTSLKKTML